MHDAKFWQLGRSGKIQCVLCPHRCLISNQQAGRCRIRVNHVGRLQARGYGLISAAHNDPIEKKPLYHFYPGSQIFSVGGWSCNLTCSFCQNWTISQQLDLAAHGQTPAAIVEQALAARAIGIAYTYNEPLINIEFVHDCASLARQAGLQNVLVTNGYIEEAPAAWLLPFIAALNIDIKSMDDAFYRQYCAGRLAPVLRFAKQAQAAGCHLEITNLLIPGLNDAAEQLERLAAWVSQHLGAAVPLHLSAYHPDYRMRLPATSAELLQSAYTICRRFLQHVYLGNLPGSRGQDTHCRQCGARLIERQGYAVRLSGLLGQACASCGSRAALILPASPAGS